MMYLLNDETYEEMEKKLVSLGCRILKPYDKNTHTLTIATSRGISIDLVDGEIALGSDKQIYNKPYGKNHWNTNIFWKL